jgi:hypothetical protein
MFKEMTVAPVTQMSVQISHPKPENLSEEQQCFLEAIKEHVAKNGIELSPVSLLTDSMESRIRALSRVDGVLVIAFRQWRSERLYRDQSPVITPSEFSHIDSALAVAGVKPLLLLRESELGQRGVLRSGAIPHVVKIPRKLDPKWVRRDEFKGEFDKWLSEVKCRRDVFLGYSSKATGLAKKIYRFLNETMGLRVFDWHDFIPGESIWDSIERAERFTNCGIFLFMADDHIRSAGKDQYAPRDNVVYEAGYFAGSKGRDKSLIIVEKGAKVPSDLGGILYCELRNRADISSAEASLRRALEKILPARGA